MSDYNFQEIEKKWQKYWKDQQTFKVTEDENQPKYYVLDMFPYPSGAGLHVGHPLGYIASDIYARYKRLKKFNVLHPMGYDSFGLPAEQYAIQTGQHPAKTTEINIARYREQLEKIGFSFDWSREIRTSNPDYYRWTQWIFRLFFNSYYDVDLGKAQPIEKLIEKYEKTDPTWKNKSEAEKKEIIDSKRLAYLKNTLVNWCPNLGTVLANDEVINGLSERGGHPVEQKEMLQWNLGMSFYAERLLKNLKNLDWSEAIKEQQRNWIGRSVGAKVNFFTEKKEILTVFTTRPDTLYGVTFLAMAPETFQHFFEEKNYTEEVKSFIQKLKNKSEAEKQRAKEVEGIFSGHYAIHPLTEEKIPIFIASYVLATYGTGIVMGCPAGDERDYKFRKTINKSKNNIEIKIKNIFKNFDNVEIDISEKACEDRNVLLTNSDFWNHLTVEDAIDKAIEILEEKNLGFKEINYRLRDAGFSRQRYWGEPFPVYHKDNQPYLTPENFPVELPNIEAYLPTAEGLPPLARAKNWVFMDEKNEKYPLECNTMPGWAGSSWYFLRYMDPKNEREFVSKEKLNYWKNVDLYVGGAEHATGHLLYARFWTMFLHDLGYLPFEEPFQKLVNQGMILGRSSLIYRLDTISDLPNPKPIYVSKSISDRYDKAKANEQSRILMEIEDDIKFKVYPEDAEKREFRISSINAIHVDIALVDNDILDLEKYKTWAFAEKDAEFICEENGTFICDFEIEKMSKSKHNVQTPDELVEKFGADTLRCYEMFLGPVEQFKPWDTKGINGVHNFLRKFWRLFHQNETFFVEKNAEPSKEMLKTLHKTIKKVQEDLERFSWNTVVSTLMIAVNELTEQKCNHQQILEPLTILLSSYAPHIAEEIWEKLGYQTSVAFAEFPIFEEKYILESHFAYPISINGKMRFNLELSLDLSQAEIEKIVVNHEKTQNYLEGKNPKKIIVVLGKIVNIVV